MTPLDVELLLAQHLESAGLGLSTSGSPPNLCAGPFPVNGPPALVCVRHTGGENGVYLGGGGTMEPDLQVVVRGNRESYEATRTLAAQCWTALHLAKPAGFTGVRCEGAGPVFMGPDGNGCPRFSFNVTAHYVA